MFTLMLNVYENLYKIITGIYQLIWQIFNEHLDVCYWLFSGARFMAMTNQEDKYYFVYLYGVGFGSKEGLFLYVTILYEFLFDWYIFICYFYEFRI